MYDVELDPVAEQQRDTLPADALAAFMELRALLEVAPWSGQPLRPDNPKANMLTHTFGGYGVATYVALEERRLVYVVRLVWLG
ncbi:hypothetical protein ETD86_35580 [Nonomuraea turkmeniaca]|uniref:Uncharacterized protein n=1 Tax=Nonomuraea turkmeniaca TaxID=103838 RepID=A0A5S4F5X9_9ACTN|nr:hypothetical protein [Nonomuraea turkmeniaca]TMR11511.1 hypothetical protein ETD86_35580 [Nonomuraea turkmeniaca]